MLPQRSVPSVHATELSQPSVPRYSRCSSRAEKKINKTKTRRAGWGEGGGGGEVVGLVDDINNITNKKQTAPD